MLTRCPACETHFRVTTEQLKLRAGRVRCGECQHVFNALDTLIEEASILVAPPPQTPEVLAEASNPPIAVAPAPTFEPSAAEEIEPPAIEGLDGAKDTENPLDQSPPGVDSVPAETIAAAIDSAPPPPSEIVEEHEPPTEAPPDWVEDFAEPPPPRRWPWVTGCLLGFAALVIQGLVIFRTELAILVPGARPFLAAVCEPLGCSVGLPAKVTLVGIEASDLHPDPARKGRLELTATLKNRAPFPQEYPHLELTLTDTADTAIVRKVIGPADYVPRGTATGVGMTPNADLAIAISLDAGELPASGYRLYIFYP